MESLGLWAYLFRIFNLAVKEINVVIDSLAVDVNGPFNMTMWAPLRTGGSPFVARGNLTSGSWYEVRKTGWEYLRHLTIKTNYWLNMFPYEFYETEIIFGFSVDEINYSSISRPYLSWGLEQQGYWTVNVTIRKTSDQKIAEIKDKLLGAIERFGVKSFVSS